MSNQGLKSDDLLSSVLLLVQPSTAVQRHLDSRRSFRLPTFQVSDYRLTQGAARIATALTIVRHEGPAFVLFLAPGTNEGHIEHGPEVKPWSLCGCHFYRSKHMQRGKREYRSRPDRDSTTGHATGNGRRVGHGCSEIIKVIWWVFAWSKVSGRC